MAGEIGAAKRENGEDEEEELEKEKPIVAEALKGGVGLDVGEEFLPKERAGDEFNDAFALEQIEEDHDRYCGREEKRRWFQKAHGEGRLAGGGAGLKLCFLSSAGRRG